MHHWIKLNSTHVRGERIVLNLWTKCKGIMCLLQLTRKLRTRAEIKLAFPDNESSIWPTSPHPLLKNKSHVDFDHTATHLQLVQVSTAIPIPAQLCSTSLFIWSRVLFTWKTTKCMRNWKLKQIQVIWSNNLKFYLITNEAPHKKKKKVLNANNLVPTTILNSWF